MAEAKPGESVEEMVERLDAEDKITPEDAARFWLSRGFSKL